MMEDAPSTSTGAGWLVHQPHAHMIIMAINISNMAVLGVLTPMKLVIQEDKHDHFLAFPLLLVSGKVLESNVELLTSCRSRLARGIYY